MSEIKGILLVLDKYGVSPASPRHRAVEQLLDELGVGGSRPPTAYLIGEPYRDKPTWVSTRMIYSEALEAWVHNAEEKKALILAWGGKQVSEGLDRAARAYRGAPWNGTGLDVILGHRAVWESMGTLVLVDAEGQEVKDERA